jgi:hypothetical protein
MAREYMVVDPASATLLARVRDVLAKDKELPSKCLMILNSTVRVQCTEPWVDFFEVLQLLLWWRSQ